MSKNERKWAQATVFEVCFRLFSYYFALDVLYILCQLYIHSQHSRSKEPRRYTEVSFCLLFCFFIIFSSAVIMLHSLELLFLCFLCQVYVHPQLKASTPRRRAEDYSILKVFSPVSTYPTYSYSQIIMIIFY